MYILMYFPAGFTVFVSTRVRDVGACVCLFLRGYFVFILMSSTKKLTHFAPSARKNTIQTERVQLNLSLYLYSRTHDPLTRVARAHDPNSQTTLFPNPGRSVFTVLHCQCTAHSIEILIVTTAT